MTRSSAAMTANPTAMRPKKKNAGGLAFLLLTFGLILYLVGSLRLSGSVSSSAVAVAVANHQKDDCPSGPGTNSAQPYNKDADFSFLCNDPAVSYLQVADPPATKNAPKILCLVLTQSKHHETRLKAVVDTWGGKCDKLVAASDQTDSTLGALKVESRQGYWNIWDKLLHTLKYMVEDPTIRQGGYDWIVKADDDTYFLYENLQAHLINITETQRRKGETNVPPLIYGRTMPWPRLKRFREMKGWFNDPLNKDFGDRLFNKVSSDDTLRFSHGGPGYVMNWKYVETLVHAYFTSTSTTSGGTMVDAVQGEVAEDIANAVTMLYQDVRPRSTLDMETGRERMHPESPQTMFANPIWLRRMHHGMQNTPMGTGTDCCSPNSISFHYVADFQMRLLDYQLYHCPRPAPS